MGMSGSPWCIDVILYTEALKSLDSLSFDLFHLLNLLPFFACDRILRVGLFFLCLLNLGCSRKVFGL